MVLLCATSSLPNYMFCFFFYMLCQGSGRHNTRVSLCDARWHPSEELLIRPSVCGRGIQPLFDCSGDGCGGGEKDVTKTSNIAENPSWALSWLLSWALTPVVGRVVGPLRGPVNGPPLVAPLCRWAPVWLLVTSVRRPLSPSSVVALSGYGEDPRGLREYLRGLRLSRTKTTIIFASVLFLDACCFFLSCIGHPLDVQARPHVSALGQIQLWPHSRHDSRFWR